MSNTKPALERKLSLLHATAINMIDMVGIGPFVVLSVVAQIMGGPYFLYAWVAGALLSYLDAMVWSQLGAALPRAGGSFHFLKEGYGEKAGSLMSFLFVWQTMIQAPISNCFCSNWIFTVCQLLFSFKFSSRKSSEWTSSYSSDYYYCIEKLNPLEKYLCFYG